MNKLSNKNSSGRWFETLRRLCDVINIDIVQALSLELMWITHHEQKLSNNLQGNIRSHLDPFY